MILLPLLLLFAVTVQHAAADCHPVCTWQCDSPTCLAVCRPICAPPACSITNCSLSAPPGCSSMSPVCWINCPSDECQETCPVCETLCAALPTSCMGAPAYCDVTCPELECSWSCHKPGNCPAPTCELQCDMPACATPSTASRVVVGVTATMLLLWLLLGVV